MLHCNQRLRRPRPASLSLALLATLTSLLVACGGSEEGDHSATGNASVSGIEGLWLADGYGQLAEIDSTSIQPFEVTAISCLPTGEQMTLTANTDGSWTLALDDDPVAGILTLESDGTLRIQPTGTASYRTFRRIAARPEVCEQTAVNGPIANFDVFWTTFDEHYPFFELKGIDWDAVRTDVRSSISDDTTPEELFERLSGMIAALEDAHTYLTAKDLDRRFQGLRSDPEVAGADSVDDASNQIETRFERAIEIIEGEYIEGDLESRCKGHLRFGHLPGGLFYVRLDQEGDYTDEPSFAAELDTFEAALDEVFRAAQGSKGLILDVRKNYGGSDILSLALASRLAVEEFFAYAKTTVLDPDDPAKRTPPQERTVPVSARPGFHGPVVQLIGRYTISAGETLTQALMGREPHIVRVGENTQGVFSDVLSRQLPNGWRFGLPNELFLTQDGTTFDGPGIPPDVEVPVFRQADLDAARDPALEKAIDLLKN